MHLFAHKNALLYLLYEFQTNDDPKNGNELPRTTSESEKPSNLPWNLFPSSRTFLTLAGRHVLNENLSKYGLGYNK